MIITILAITASLLVRDDGQWADQPPEIRQWFQSVMQPDNPAVSCCGSGDAFEVELEGDEPDGDIAVRIIAGPVQELIGAEVDVPRSKLQARYGNPLDKYILFIGQGGKIYCFIPKVEA